MNQILADLYAFLLPKKKKKEEETNPRFLGCSPACFLNLCSYCESQPSASRREGVVLSSWEWLNHRDQGLCQGSSRRSCGGSLKPDCLYLTTPVFAGCYCLCSSECESLSWLWTVPPALVGQLEKIAMVPHLLRSVPFEVCDTHILLCCALVPHARVENFPQ